MRARGTRDVVGVEDAVTLLSQEFDPPPDKAEISDILLNLARARPDFRVSLREARVVIAWLREARQGEILADMSVVGALQVSVRKDEIVFSYPTSKSEHEIYAEIQSTACPACKRLTF